jgi:hypothetical protein
MTGQKVSTRAKAEDPRVVSYRYGQLMHPIVIPRQKRATFPARVRGEIVQTRDPKLYHWQLQRKQSSVQHVLRQWQEFILTP